MNAPVPPIVDRLQTVTKAGLPVKERITTVEAARDLYNKAWRAWEPVAIRRARVKGQADGNPPYSQTRLEELGLGYMNNINYLEMRAILDQKAAANFELFFEAPTLVECKLRRPDQLNEPTPEWAQIVAEEFSKLCLNWSGFLPAMDRSRRESDLHGIGVCIWRDEWDWRPKAIGATNFLPDPMASLDVEEMPFWFVRDEVTAGDLYKWALEDEAIGAEEGWDVSAVKKFLIKTYVHQMGQQTNQNQYSTFLWEDFQERKRLNDPSIQVLEFERLRILHVCIKEVDDGKVSHYILEDAIGPTTAIPEDRFLFRMTRRFNKMSECLWILPYNFGDGYLKSTRGLASMVEQHCDMSNRFLNRVYDAGFTIASLLLQPETAMDLSKLQLVRMGIVTVLPPGVKVQQSSFQPQISPLVQLRDLSVNVMRNNSGVWREFSEAFAENQAPKTARQVASEETRESRMEKANIAFDYEHMEKLYREMFRRVVRGDYLGARAKYGGQEEARTFVANCVARGVPEALLQDSSLWEVYVARTIGMGSWGVKLDLSNQILGIRGLFDEQGQTAAIRDWIGVRAGYRNVDRYKPLINRNTIPSNEDSIAVLENNDMQGGGQVPVGSDQNHYRHLANAHIPLLEQILQAAAQGQQLDPDKTLGTLGVLLQHIQGHSQWLSQDPARKPFVDQVEKLMKKAIQLAKILQTERQKMQAMQQQHVDAQGQLVDSANKVAQDREYQLKVLKMQQEMELHKQKMDSLNAQRDMKAKEGLALKKEMASASLQLQAERQAADLQNQAKITDAKLEMERLKAASAVALKGGPRE